MEKQKKKVLILSLSCDLQPYLQEENIIKETWAKSIVSGEKDNFNLLFMHSSNENSIDLENHVIYAISSDDYYGTGEKTLKSLITLYNNPDIEFDYILLTNTATVINIDLVDKFVNSALINDDKIYGGRLVFPVLHVPFLRGDFTLISKKLVKEVVNNSAEYIGRRMANDEVVVWCLLKYREFKGPNIINQFIEVNAIDCFEDYSFKDVNSSTFYVNTKIEGIDRNDNDVMISAMKLAWFSMNWNKSEIDLGKLIKKPTLVQFNNGLFKMEFIKD